MTDDSPVPFLVTSCGQAGSLWLASSLHLHPEILCSVGVDHPLFSLNYSHNLQEMLELRASITHGSDMLFGAAPSLKNALAQGGYFTQGSSEHTGKHRDIFSPMDGVPDRNLNHIPAILFGELNYLPPIKAFKAYGNVHGVSALNYTGELLRGAEAFNGLANDLVVMDLIRHPITRLDSVINLYATADQRGDGSDVITVSMAQHAELLAHLESRYHVDFTQSINRVFFWIESVLIHSRGWAEDIMIAPDIPRILFEKIRADRDHFRDVVHTLTKNTVVADDQYLDRIFAPENLDQGRFSSGSARKDRSNPKAIFEAWPRWQQQEVARIFKEYDLFAAYKAYPYDLSFLHAI